MLRIAAFVSHPIQHLTPLWQAVTRRGDVRLKVFYFSNAGVVHVHDPEFGQQIQWDVDLCAGHAHEFLPRRWPTRDPADYRGRALNGGLARALREGWDAAYVAGWGHLNNWALTWLCRRYGIPSMIHSDASIITAFDKRWLVLAAKRLVLPRFLRSAAAGLAIGDKSREFLIHYGTPPERTFFVPIPVDIERFRAAVREAGGAGMGAMKRKYGIPENKRIVVFTGKLVPRKRPLDMLDALRRLGRDDVVGVFVGEGPLRPDIEARRQPNIVITGFVNQTEMPLLTAMGEVLVMPSDYDAHPLSVTEALCVGVPVILSDHCGCFGPNDVLRDGEDGLLYRCGDVEQLAAKIAHLLDHEDERLRMGRRGQELAETQSPEAAAQRLVEAARTIQHLYNGHAAR